MATLHAGSVSDEKEVHQEGKVVAHQVTLNDYDIELGESMKAKMKDGHFGSLIDDLNSIDHQRLRQPSGSS